MDYEKKYNNIVDTLQSLIADGKKQGHIIIRIDDIENAIPELKELEGEKKSVYKAEPKFKVGDWITFYGGKPFKIIKIEAEINGVLDYLLLNQNGHDSYYNKRYVDENARLWTIQDAKDGDVLASGQVVFMFKMIHGVWLNCHCSLHNGGSFIAHSYDLLTDKYFSEVHPATKEQRELLFEKMEEEGYEWDNVNKQPEKIES